MGEGGRRPAAGPPPERGLNVLVVNAPTTCAELQVLCERLRNLLDGGSEAVVCDVAGVLDPDAGTVEALARLQLVAVRLGGRLRFVNACDELRGLLTLTGLGDALPCDDEPCGPMRDASGVEPRRKTEERKYVLRVEEERDARDPTL